MLRTRIMAGRVAGFVMAAVLAITVLAIHTVDALVPAWQPVAGRATPVALRVPVGPAPTGLARHQITRVVAPGDVVDAATVAAIRRHDRARRDLAPGYVAGLGFVYFLTGLLLFTYLRRLGPSRARLLRTHLGLLPLVVALAAACKALLLFTPLPEFWLPVATVPLWVTLYVDRRAAMVFNLALSFVVASLAGFDVTLIVALLARGLASTLAFRDWKHPRSMITAGVTGGVAAALAAVAMRAVTAGGFDVVADVALGWRGAIASAAGGGLVVGVLAWALQGPVGRALGVVSRARLLDLADLDHPVLQRMAAGAPGSWEHSRAMANLAEAASAAIGADALLTRVGAYYHDLGKTVQSKYFVENLSPGERSPHEDLDPDVSADAIMVHVVQGTQILRDAGIPEPVVEFSYTHHGTSVIEFFWHKCQQQGNPKALAEDAFRYPGMKPQTRETAILMLVDGIEAAARTIDAPTLEKFEEMIRRVVFSKVKQGQLDDSGLTIEDLHVIVSSLARTLVNVYHHRIKYPWQREPGNGERPAAPPPTPPPPAPPAPPPAPSAAQPTPAVGGGGDGAPRASVVPPEPAPANGTEPAPAPDK